MSELLRRFLRNADIRLASDTDALQRAPPQQNGPG